MIEAEKRMAPTKILYFCWIMYFCTYLGRLSFTTNLAEIVLVEHLSKAQGGLIGTIFFVLYGVGQVFSGFMADRLSPTKLIFIGTLLSAASNFGFALISDFIVRCIIWGVNGIAQSLVWSPIVRLISEHFDEQKRTKALIQIGSSGPAGMLAAYGLSALLLLVTKQWKTMFLVSGAILAGMSIFWLYQTKKMAAPTFANETDKTTPLKSKVSLKAALAGSGVVYICLVLLLQGMLKDGIVTWVPAFLADTYSVGGSLAIISTAIIPLSNLLGVYFAAIIQKKIHNEVKASGVIFIGAALVLGALFFVMQAPAQGVMLGLIVLTILLLALSTTLMMAVNILLINLVPGYFAYVGRSAGISGILNAAAYAGCAFSSYGFGAISSAFGWSITVLFWVVCAVMGIVLCFIGARLWQHKRKSLLQDQ